MTALPSDSSNRHPLVESYQFLLYSSAVSDNGFDFVDRRTIRKRRYEIDAWVGRGGHRVCFRAGDVCVTDIVVPSGAGWPEENRLGSFGCAGDHECAYFIGGQIEYTGAVQAEILKEHQYGFFLDEMVEYARQVKALMIKWDHVEGAGGVGGEGAGNQGDSEGGVSGLGLGASSVSVISLQPMAGEAHVQAWHLDGSCGLVVRTQAIFELIPTAVVKRRGIRRRVR